ncbi:MAG: carbohydrate binding family 9 domain-containing protein [Acidobacteria bacterium]|nr:carbohydrate binding family 9 domain-containing protein [Acidobacteriota bacterium]
MTVPIRRAIIVVRAYVLAAIVAGLTVGSVVADTPRLATGRISESINFDGRLDEPVWGKTQAVRLVQQSPRPGQETPYVTEVRVLLSAQSVYFGFICHDPHPEQIAVHTMRRDGDASGDDTVALVLDTYGDRRTGYFFQINATGARVDGLIDNPESASLDWDAIWDARTARLPTGWSAEIVIPARSLSFTPRLTEWGLNVERSIPRERMMLRWASPTLDSFLYDLSRAGVLTGIGELEQDKGIEVRPYAAGRTKRFFGVSPRAWQAAEGGDVTWRITPQLLMVFTANTDFAETEVDTRQINLTRFPLLFPEKREFFLEGANQYTFGLGLGGQFIPFFSRNIGLLDGAQIPLDGGIKFSGRVGKWNLAFLDVQTRKTKVTTVVEQDLGLHSPVLAGTNLLASRASYDFKENLRLGMILTHGDPAASRSNTLAGVDAVWRTSKFRGDKNFLVGLWMATTQGDVPAGSKLGWGFKVDYPNDLLDCKLVVNQYGAAFEPLMGFLPRPGTRQTNLGCAYQPRPSKTGPFRWIRQEFFENEYFRVTNSQGIVESWQYFMAPINVRLESGDRFEFNWSPRGETLLAPFEISPGVVIPPGSYHFTRWRLEAQTSSHRPLQFGTTTWFGGFFNGHLTQQETYVKWTSPRGQVQIELDTENDFARLPEGNFVQRLWQLQTAYAWNPNVVITSFVQYDTESQNVGTNTRLRWTIRPGNDFFVIWNRGWQRRFASSELSLTPQTDLIAVKVRWTFRL